MSLAPDKAGDFIKNFYISQNRYPVTMYPLILFLGIYWLIYARLHL